MSDERVEQWVRVPDGSTLRISVTGTTETASVLGTIDMLDSDNNTKIVSLDTVTGKPFELDIVKGKRYSVDVLLTYQTAATATVRAEIRTSEGKIYGDAYDNEITGAAKIEEFVSFFVFAVRQ